MQNILIVNTNLRNLELLAQYLDLQGFKSACASTYEEFAKALANCANLSVAIIDITGFDPQIWTYCDQMSAKAIPFLIVAPKLSRALHKESIANGSSGVLEKPLVPRDLTYILQSLLDKQH